MHKCSKCGTEYEGNFCPECGAKWEEAKTCPKCGKALERGVKFCPGCGYSFVPAPATSSKPASAASPVTVKTVKRYTSIAVFPAVLFVLLSVIFMLLFLAPVAVMPGGELLGQKIPSESYGNVYEISNYADTSLTGSLTMLIVFAACALFLAALIVFTAPFIKARYKRVMIFGKRIFLRNVFAGIGYVLFFLLFLISCILLGQISNEDGGFGIFTAGAAPILIIVFALIGCLVALIFALVARHMRQTYPVLVRVQERIIATAEPTGFEIWVKKHKVVTAILSVVVVAAVIVGVSFSFIGATRNNGVYYAYNGATEQYNMQQYYKISGNSWQDNDGNKGEIIIDGENVTLIYDASGGMDKTGSSKIELKGTLVNDVLNLNGTVYATGGHKHEYGNWHAGDAGTCVQKATEAHDCACGRRETRETDNLGDHVYVNNGKEATCADYGIEGEYCSLCGKLSSSAKYIPALHVKYSWSSSGQYLYVSGLSEECDHREITIPQYYPYDTYDNKLYPVKSISGFKNHTTLTSITLPDGVTSIGDEAFLGCTSLTSITIPDSVTSIGESAFSGCSSLKSITIPDDVTSIGESAFSGCSSLKSITIPDGVTSIGESAFSGCTSLASITIGSGVTSIGASAFSGTAYYDDEKNWDGGNVFYMGNILLEAKTTISGEYSIREGTKKIASYAFAGEEYTNNRYSGCPNLTSITIPDSVTEIGYRAFYGCSGLTNITIPDGVTSIGKYAFYGCSSLESITIPNGVTSIGQYAFYGCSSLESIIIPDSVTSIENSAFSHCSGLTSVTIGNGVTSIGDYAFRDCSGLESIIIPDGVTSIDESAFSGCSGLESIIIPDGVTSIGESAFSGCTSLASITIGSGVTSIGNEAFYGCSKLEHITVAEGNKFYRGEQDCLIEIETSTLILGCKNSIIPYGVTKIGESAFKGCSGLTSITIPNGVTSIRYEAFYGCSSLESIIIPDSVTSIGYRAFYGCSGLTNVTIGGGVTSIGQYAFYGCSGLTGVYISNLSAWCKIYFGNSTANPLCYAHHLYLDNVELKELTIPDEITEVKPFAFYNCNGLTSVTIGSGVTSIGEYAFAFCSGLTSIVIPDSVTSIGNKAFRSCSELTEIQFKGTVKEWQTIEKESEWNYNTGNYTITCTDGTIDKGGNVTYFEQ